jgi:hypothetical protein
MIWLRRIGIVLACVAVLAIVAWLLRAPIAGALIGFYFKKQGVVSDVTISRLEWSGLAGRFALGDARAPTISADEVQAVFDNSGWLPKVVALRVEHPVVRARVDANGTVSLPDLQAWIDKITSGPAGHSRFVSDDLAVDLQNLRAIVTTPGGVVDLSGNAQMKRGAPTFADVTAQPTALSRNGQVLRIDGARLSARTLPTGLSVNAQFTGSLNRDAPRQALRAAGVKAVLSASGIRWGGGSASVASAQIKIAAQDMRVDAAHAIAPDVQVTLANIRTAPSGQWQADIRGQAEAQTMPSDMQRLFARIPVAGADRALGNAFTAATQAMTLTVAGDVHGGGGAFGMRLAAPATLAGRNGAILRVNTLALEHAAQSTRGSVDAQLSGGGLPSLALISHRFVWIADSFEADAALRARFDFAMLRDADLSASGNASLRQGRFAFTLRQCAQARIGAVRAGRKTMLRKIASALCAAVNSPVIASDANAWSVTAAAKNLEAEIPAAAAKLSNGKGQFQFAAKNGKLTGRMQLANARIADRAKSARFRPLTGSGTATLANDRVRGEADVTGPHRARIGQVTFVHDLNTGSGKAEITARDVRFDPKGLQPADLSPLLAQVRNATGRASFTGTVAWTRKTMTSRGVLDIAQLDFASPLGPAHALQSSIAFQSLLPPVTADGQKLDIASVDWTLPFTGTKAVFALAPDALRVESAKTNVAGGAASLDGMTVELGGKAAIRDTARLDNIDLAQVVAATNIGNRVKVTGRVNGVLPFTVSTEGFRISKGHIESVGPGRLSIDRTLWTKDAAVNGVQNFAYQALENLAVDSMTADVDSVDNGRLRIVFHIKGRNDPPKPQEARVGLFDLLRGTAFDKPVALPSGTPIDLTLETSLNFDELLKSYQAAWSQTLATAPAPKRGTKK